MSTTLTDEQVKDLYETLDKVKNTDKFEVPENEDASVTEAEIEEIPALDGSEEKLDLTNVKPEKTNYLNAFEPYGFKDDEAISFMNILIEYGKNGVNDEMYDQLPQQIKMLVEQFISMDIVNGELSKTMSKKALRRHGVSLVLDSFVNDAKMDTVLNEYQEELNSTMGSINSDIQKIMSDSIDEIHAQLPLLKETNPEQAEKIESILQAFDEAKTFKLQLECAEKISPKKLRKLHERYANEVFYFNKKANSSKYEIKVPDIDLVLGVLKNEFMDYPFIVLEKTVIVLIQSIIGMDMDELRNTAYVYRMISNITDFRFITDPNKIDAEGKEIFDNLRTVIDVLLSKEGYINE